MDFELIILVLLIVLIMIATRIICGEIDNRTATRRENIAWYLQFTRRYKYHRPMMMVIIMSICLMLFTDINLRTLEGWIDFAICLGLVLVSDYISGFVLHIYAKKRFKAGIDRAITYLVDVDTRLHLPFNEDEIEETEPAFDLTAIMPTYMFENDHIVYVSNNGGEGLNHLAHFPQVTFLIDTFKEAATKLFANTPVRIVDFVNKDHYPFKDQSMDMVVLDEANMNPEEVGRILKDEGYLIISQRGDGHLHQMKFFNLQLVTITVMKWTLEALHAGLENNGYQIVDSIEKKGELRFKSLSAFYHYAKQYQYIDFSNLEYIINQIRLLDNSIKNDGYYAMTTHRFMAIAKKRGL